MRSEFWNTKAESMGGPFTQELLRETLEAMRRELDRQPERCPHLHPYGYVKRLCEQGVTETRCRWCGAFCRV